MLAGAAARLTGRCALSAGEQVALTGAWTKSAQEREGTGSFAAACVVDRRLATAAAGDGCACLLRDGVVIRLPVSEESVELQPEDLVLLASHSLPEDALSDLCSSGSRESRDLVTNAAGVRARLREMGAPGEAAVAILRLEERAFDYARAERVLARVEIEPSRRRRRHGRGAAPWLRGAVAGAQRALRRGAAAATGASPVPEPTSAPSPRRADHVIRFDEMDFARPTASSRRSLGAWLTDPLVLAAVAVVILGLLAGIWAWNQHARSKRAQRSSRAITSTQTRA